MFFHITSDKNFDPVWPLQHHQNINNFVVYTDLGWKRLNNTIYKGYCIEQNLDQKVASMDYKEQTGNYTIIDLDRCTYYCDNSRSYPLYYNQSTVTNINNNSVEPIWFDATVIFNNNRWHWQQKTENVYLFDSMQKTVNKEYIVNMICNYLVDTVQQFSTELPVYIANSSGVDTLMIRSAFDYCGITYKTVDHNTKKLQSLGWGYGQLYVSDRSHLQVTGFCGDELLLRNPLYCQWLLDPHNINLADEFDQFEYSYMKGFFNANYKKKIKNRNNKFVTVKSAFEHVANVAMNDYQMWHIDNTITFTPLRNKNTAIECLYADVDCILDQVIHAGISKQIIQRLNAKNLKLISKHKNNYA